MSGIQTHLNLVKPNVKAPEVPSNLTLPGIVDKIRARTARVTAAVTERFKEAKEEFFFVLERETAWQKRGPLPVVPIKNASVAGYLIADRGRGFLPLYEGMNRIALNPTGPALADDNGEAQYQIRVTSQEVRLETGGGMATRSTLESNQLVKLGDHQFVVKLLPENYWAKRSHVFAKGGNHETVS